MDHEYQLQQAGVVLGGRRLEARVPGGLCDIEELAGLRRIPVQQQPELQRFANPGQGFESVIEGLPQVILEPLFTVVQAAGRQGEGEPARQHPLCIGIPSGAGPARRQNLLDAAEHLLHEVAAAAFGLRLGQREDRYLRDPPDQRLHTLSVGGSMGGAGQYELTRRPVGVQLGLDVFEQRREPQVLVEQNRPGAGYAAVRIVFDPAQDSRIVQVDDFSACGRGDLSEQGGLAHRPGPFEQRDRVNAHAAADHVEDAALVDEVHRDQPPSRTGGSSLEYFRISPKLFPQNAE